MLSTAFWRGSLSVAAVRRPLVGTISSAAMGNRPSVGRRGFANGTINTVKPDPPEEERGPMGLGGGGWEGAGTQCTVTKRWEYHGNNSMEGSFDQGQPFAPLSLSDLKKCKVYFQLIQRLVNLPAPQWMNDIVSACSIQDSHDDYFFSDPYTGKLVNVMSPCCSPMEQSQTTVNFLLYNPSQKTSFPLHLTVFSLNFSRHNNWALTVDTKQQADNDMYDVTFKSCNNCQTANLPTLTCTLTHSGDAFTVTQTVDGQDYCFIQMPDSILGRHCSVIKAVKCIPHCPLPSAAAYLTFKAPIQFCSEETDDK